MTETLTVRDHSQPCKHYRPIQEGELSDFWPVCPLGYTDCPGGREIVLRGPYKRIGEDAPWYEVVDLAAAAERRQWRKQ